MISTQAVQPHPVRVLAIDSSFDELTLSGTEYRKRQVYPRFVEHRHEVVEQQGLGARRYPVRKALTTQNIRYVTGVGHGGERRFIGDQYEYLFDVGNYRAEEVRGRIVHLLSCWIARELGQAFRADGCDAFFGYDEEFVLPMPREPEMMERFWACDAAIDLALARGATTGEAKAEAIDRFTSTIESLRRHGHYYTAAQLEYNRNNLRLFGDETARL